MIATCSTSSLSLSLSFFFFSFIHVSISLSFQPSPPPVLSKPPLITPSYPAQIAHSLPPHWRIAEVLLSSSYRGWGTSSLQKDAHEIARCVAYFSKLRPGRKIVLMGHSTGCQDIMEYVVGKGIYPLVKLYIKQHQPAPPPTHPTASSRPGTHTVHRRPRLPPPNPRRHPPRQRQRPRGLGVPARKRVRKGILRRRPERSNAPHRRGKTKGNRAPRGQRRPARTRRCH